MEHDASYKLLFSHARMVEALLRGFVHEAWVRKVQRDIRAAVQHLETRDTLHMLLRQAITCPNLEAFRDTLRSTQLIAE